MQFLLIDRMIHEVGLYVYNMHNKVERHFSISIAHVRSRAGRQLIKKRQYLGSQ
jgi:hypothetical protein